MAWSGSWHRVQLPRPSFHQMSATPSTRESVKGQVTENTRLPAKPSHSVMVYFTRVLSRTRGNPLCMRAGSAHPYLAFSPATQGTKGGLASLLARTQLLLFADAVRTPVVPIQAYYPSWSETMPCGDIARLHSTLAYN